MIVSVKETIQTPLYIRKYRQLHPHSPPRKISVVLTLVAAGAVEGPVAVGLAPRSSSSSSRALHVVSTEGGVRGSGCVLAGVRVFLGEEGRVGPQLVPLEGQERQARLFLGTEGIGQKVDDRKAKMGERCGGMIRGGSGDAAVLERRRGGEQREREREKETLISWLGRLAKAY